MYLPLAEHSIVVKRSILHTPEVIESTGCGEILFVVVVTAMALAFCYKLVTSKR